MLRRPETILDEVAAATTITDEMADELELYAWTIAHNKLPTYSIEERRDAVQEALLQVLSRKPQTGDGVLQRLRNTIWGYYRTEERRREKHPRESYTRKTSGDVLTNKGFMEEAQFGFGTQLIDFYDRCVSDIQREFIRLVCEQDMSAEDAAAELGMSKVEILAVAAIARE